MSLQYSNGDSTSSLRTLQLLSHPAAVADVAIHCLALQVALIRFHSARLRSPAPRAEGPLRLPAARDKHKLCEAADEYLELDPVL